MRPLAVALGWKYIYATYTNQHKSSSRCHWPIQPGDSLRTICLCLRPDQIALDPVSGELVGEDVQVQTHRALQNLQAVLSSAGTSLANIVKTTVFLAHMNDFQAMNAIYATYFTGVAPARSTVGVAELPRKALVEIECVALIEDS